MIALAPGNEAAALRLADLEEILARHLERGLDALRAAGHEIDRGDAGRRVGDQRVGQRFGDIGGEERGVGVGEAVDLRLHRLRDLGVVVAEARHRGATARIDVALALGVLDMDAVAARGDRRRRTQLPMKDMVHRLDGSAAVLR